MGAYAIRVSENGPDNETPITPNEVYEDLTPSQFNYFIRSFLKQNIITRCGGNLTTADKTNINTFFEDVLPNDLIADFDSEAAKRVLMMYITSNLTYGFGIELNQESLYNAITRLQAIDPR